MDVCLTRNGNAGLKTTQRGNKIPRNTINLCSLGTLFVFIYNTTRISTANLMPCISFLHKFQ